MGHQGQALSLDKSAWLGATFATLRFARQLPRLSSLTAQVTGLAPAIGYAQGNERERNRYRAETQPHREWYRTHRWQKLRWSVLVDQLFTCRTCTRVVVPSSEAVADHIVPHRGNASLFWDPSNIQCLCKPCHDSAKQREERADATRAGTGGWVQPAKGPSRPDGIL